MGQIMMKNKVKGDMSAVWTQSHYDPVLVQLFSTSLGPVRSDTPNQSQSRSRIRRDHENGIHAHAISNSSTNRSERDLSESTTVKSAVPGTSDIEDFRRKGRKRKRHEAQDDLEGLYMRQMAHKEAIEEARDNLALSSMESTSTQARKTHGQGGSLNAHSKSGEESGNHPVDEPCGESVCIATEGGKGRVADDVPQHESVTSKEGMELEKAPRTIFLANVSTMVIRSKAAKKVLVDHLTSFALASKESGLKPAIDSIRFRSTPFSDGRLPKKAAYAKKELMDSTAKSTNAYVVYTTQMAASEAVKKLNGTMVLDRHLRVDSVANPAKQDHRRCVFVGNLGFVDDESVITEADGIGSKKSPRKAKKPADYEEGLWRTFGQAGNVESVRLVRDRTTRVGKGFAYVQFADANGVEKALLYNGKQFPPMIPRNIRVVRAKSSKKSITGGKIYRPLTDHSPRSATYRSRHPSAMQTLSGRATRMLGRAGPARMKGIGSGEQKGFVETQESAIFEGHRASQGASKRLSSAKKLGKPLNRSSRRGAAFRRKGMKK
ncbi:MAG: hypothetical protein Q9163_001658 [Psora crenata]